ncbi:hypothetical protein RB653_001209 [Dictyostelium firmibasis]|uniref:Uncharacterized protein n=1 Tax=Dictyostelium firmibasis TaxID=79012 RepID=A0AAN7YRA7_9MYCE
MINFILLFIGIITLIFLIVNNILPYLFVFFSKDQDFKKKYGEWAIVTGGSSGIGKSIAHRLASQGISLILISKDENNLNEVINELNYKYYGNNNDNNKNNSNIKFLSINLDFTNSESVKDLINKLKEFELNKILKINDIRILFNNVGFLTMEGFNQTQYDNDKLKMIQCNTLTTTELTDYFYRIWVENKNKIKSKKNGVIIFTSSITGVLPTPFSVMYASCKSFLSIFATSLSLEARYNDIDILAVQPGKVCTNLFNKIPNLLVLKFLDLFQQKPDDVVNIMFRITGRYGIIIFNSGLFAVISNIALSIIGINITNYIAYFISNYILKDYSIYRDNNNNNNNNNKKNK